MKIIKKLFKTGISNTNKGIIDKKYILNLLGKEPVILDCGSHVGTDSIEFVKLNPKCTVHSVEPINEIYNQLVFNTINYKQIHTYNIALSHNNRDDIMYVSSGASDGSSSLLKPKTHLIDHPDVYFDNTQKVQCQTLDTWAQKNNISKIDLLWLDMQGMELKMLKASTKVIQNVIAVHTEVSTCETYDNVESYQEVKNFFFEKGFEICREAIPASWDMGNVLFIKKN